MLVCPKLRYFPLPSDYSDEPYKIPFETIKEASNHLLLSKPEIPIKCPVRLIHGMKDDTVPYKVSLELSGKLKTSDVVVHLIKDGDHRLSKDRNLEFLASVINKMVFENQK